MKPGMAVTIDGKLCVVVKTDHVKPGKGPAYVQARMREVGGTGFVDKRLNSSDTVEGTHLDRREAEYLYNDGTGYVFMDTETFDQFTLNEDFAGDAMLYLSPNASTAMLFHDGNPVVIELPGSVELQVTDTPPGIKGATVTNQLKEATLETGLKTRVPPFIEVGEMIKVSTADGSYMSRVKSE
ncbi:efp [Symbiodinium necroappetens]|uniref:Efp protein n=1 Tax=Symbiodinium necroappetens TaxID=1628268 RepID=A0A812KVH8_9DINO|nr:efp [Symbiodinium necroappetens]